MIARLERAARWAALHSARSLRCALHRLPILLAAWLMADMACAAAVQPARDDFAAASALGRGINILGYDPYWDGGQRRFESQFFQLIRDGGFDTVRVNLFAFKHMDARDRIDPAWLAKLDAVVAGAGKARLNVILDDHDFDFCGMNPDPCTPRLKALWAQLAAHYRNAPRSVYFEILNEPSRLLTAERWNLLLAETLAIIRRNNPTRAVIVGPVGWNSFRNLASLRLPSGDRNLIVTVHYYEPMQFTHQGAGWVAETKDLRGVAWGSAADKAKLAADFQTMADWSRANRRPLFLGEFGAYDRSPIEMRAAYDQAVARTAEHHGFSWAYWQFDGDFIAYDVAGRSWVAPIHDALIGAR